MPTWCYSLACSLRALGRELVRNLWGRVFVYPLLVANERSRERLEAFVEQRACRIGVPLDGDGTGLVRLTPGTPTLTKADVRRHPERLVRRRGPGSWLRTTIRTSGTSGTPLTIVQSIGNMVREEGFVMRQLRWIGWSPGQRRAWIRGDIVCPERPRNAVYWCRDWIGNRLLMSSYHLSNRTIAHYVDALEAFDPVVIHAYPSSVAALAGWLLAAGRRYRGTALRGVMTSSETLAPDVRAAVESAFGVTVFDWYGQSERVAAIGTCEHGRYHVLTDYGGVALLATGQGDDAWELVGTSLNNAAMPLVRYRTGDRVLLDEHGEACPCGRVFPTVKAVLGREDKTVTLPDGRLVTRLDRVFQGHDRVLVEGQVLYRGNAEFTLRVVTADGFTPADAQALIDKFLVRVPGVRVRVEQVAAIPRGPNGKFEFIAFAGDA